jgi:indole-3-glycerol phosphate synthase
MNILEEIAAYAKKRAEEDKKIVPLDKLKERCSGMEKKEHDFLKKLKDSGLSLICEVKKASPSKGVIAEEFPYIKIAKEYEKYGADCISCLTEPKWFMGSDHIFEEIRSKVKLPMLRKDFTVDEYQIYQAAAMGSDAVLLICALLEKEEIEKYLAICEELGIDALVEAHDEKEIKKAVEAGAVIIGVNNRNLKDFSVDFSNAERLREAIPQNCVYVAESGIKTAEDIGRVCRAGADAALIGETLMRSKDKRGMLSILKTAAGNKL